jgi:hypothetical protein
MRRSTVMICGLARDLGAIAPLTAKRIEQIGTRFRDYGVVLVENDSIDGTQQYLTSWAAVNPPSQYHLKQHWYRAIWSDPPAETNTSTGKLPRGIP